MSEPIEITKDGPFGHPLVFYPARPWQVSRVDGMWYCWKPNDSYGWGGGVVSSDGMLAVKKILRIDTGKEIETPEELVEYWNSIGIEAELKK